MTLETITPPATEPLALDEAKLHLNVAGTWRDDLITGMIVQARAIAEAFTRRRFITQTVEMRRSGLGGAILLQTAPVQSVTSITYLDTTATEQTLDGSLWRLARHVSPPQIVPAHLATWPAVLPDVDTVGIRFVVGYGDDAADVPADIRAALKLILGHLYENREDVVTGTIATQVPEGAAAILSRHILWV